MKRFLTFVLVTVLMLGSVLPSLSFVAAEANSKRLITVGGKTVTDDMTLDNVIKLFGEPKLITGSMFGGNACTFYGKDYSNYLYIETFSDGTIASYGSVSPDFETNEHKAGKEPGYCYYDHTAVKSDGTLFGVIQYRNYRAGLMDHYFENAAENNRNLCLHSVEMWNAVSFLYGYNTPTVFDERTFYVNQQLADNYSDLYYYCLATKKEAYLDMISWSNFTGRGALKVSYPSPLLFAEDATRFDCEEKQPAAFILRQEPNGDVCSLTGFLNPSFFSDWHEVEYTAEEKALLEKARERYANYRRLYKEAGYYYEIEPQYETLPLTAGMLNEKIGKGAVEFLNAIRVGAGIPAVTYSKELSEGAQCKSTLTCYLSVNDIDNPSPHFPPQPEGVDDEYYRKAMLGSGENLFMCGITSSDVVGSIRYALDDSYGVGQRYERGHRYNLLDPRWTEVGLGNTVQQGAHKMNGNAKPNVDVVAWPSKGIMLAESMAGNNMMFTCKFYNGYRANDDTVVTVKCLNNDKTWRIAKNSLSDLQDFNASDDLISYYDSTVTLVAGNVYEITFENLKDSNGKNVKYTYRSVYESAYVGDEGSRVQKLSLSTQKLGVGKGETRKIKATITPNTADNMMVTWESSNPSVASVNENGIVTGKSAGKAVITATTEDGKIKATCTVQVCAGHKWDKGKVTVAPNCIEEGVKTHTCTSCGGKKEENIPIVDTHAWDQGNILSEATHTAFGLIYYTCNDCGMGEFKQIEKIAEHSYGGWVYHHESEHRRSCESCGRNEYDQHKWNSGRVTKEPTLTATGVMTYTCTVCEGTKTETIPSLTAANGSSETKKPTTTTARPKVTTSVSRPIQPDATQPKPVTTTEKPKTTPKPSATHEDSATEPTDSVTIPNAPETLPTENGYGTNVPETTVSIPETATSALETTSSMPETTLNMPESVTSMPEVTSSMPETTVNIPESVTSIPETTSSMSETTPEVHGTTVASEQTTETPEQPADTASSSSGTDGENSDENRLAVVIYTVLALVLTAGVIVLIVIYIKRNKRDEQ